MAHCSIVGFLEAAMNAIRSGKSPRLFSMGFKKGAYKLQSVSSLSGLEGVVGTVVVVGTAVAGPNGRVVRAAVVGAEASVWAPDPQLPSDHLPKQALL